MTFGVRVDPGGTLTVDAVGWRFQKHRSKPSPTGAHGGRFPGGLAHRGERLELQRDGHDARLLVHEAVSCFVELAGPRMRVDGPDEPVPLSCDGLRIQQDVRKETDHNPKLPLYPLTVPAKGVPGGR